MHCFITYGPDRTGKTTLVNNTYNLFTRYGWETKVFHFSGPQEGDRSTVCQFRRALDELQKNPCDLAIFDRGPLEARFFSRRGYYPEPDPFWTTIMDFEIREFFKTEIDGKMENTLACVINKKPWEWTIPYHIEEINKGEGWGSLEERRIEHFEYYEYVRGWIETSPLAPYTDFFENYDIRRAMDMGMFNYKGGK